ncbi:MAG: hypothetical protein GY705_30610 [Bacteroidetes bacterium]|nr:hypothetical protein [Bacteroidota bacterium]
MKTKDELLEFGKEKLKEFKTILDELEVQVELGKAGAKETFEKEKKNFQEFIKEQKEEYKQAKEMRKLRLQELKEKLNALEAILSLEPTKTKVEFLEQKEVSMKCIHELEFKLKEVYHEMGSDTKVMLDTFKEDLDAFRIQLALGTFEEDEKLESHKTILKEQLERIRVKLDAESTEGGKIDHFVDEMAESFDHLKKAFTNLFS